jgi:hypothetical protein
MGRLAVFTVNHKHPLSLHLLVKSSGGWVDLDRGFDLKLKPDLDGMRVVFLEALTGFLEHTPVSR